MSVVYHRVAEQRGGIRLPDSKLARAAIRLARDDSPETIFNHPLRTFVFGSVTVAPSGIRFDVEVAFVACVLHDMGRLEKYWTSTDRFELDGADAAQRWLRKQGVQMGRTDPAWQAIALHTNGSIAIRMRPEIDFVAKGAAMDTAGVNLDQRDRCAVQETLQHSLGWASSSDRCRLYKYLPKPNRQRKLSRHSPK